MRDKGGAPGVTPICVHSQFTGSITKLWEPLVLDNGWLMILTGYIDESFDGKDEPDDFTLSCIMTTPNDWRLISGAWRILFKGVNGALVAQGRQSLSRYHATDCNGSYGEFEGWNSEEKNSLSEAMFAIFEKVEIRLTTMSYSVRLSKIMKKYPSVKDPKAFAYAMLFLLIIKGVLEMMESLPEPSAISFIHDRSDFDDVFLSVFNVVLRTADEGQRKKLTTVAAMPNIDCPPLEVADLFAYENYKKHINQIKGNKRKRTIDYLLEKDGLGGRASWIVVEESSLTDHDLDVLKWCSSFGGKQLRYPELDVRS